VQKVKPVFYFVKNVNDLHHSERSYIKMMISCLNACSPKTEVNPANYKCPPTPLCSRPVLGEDPFS